MNIGAVKINVVGCRRKAPPKLECALDLAPEGQDRGLCRLNAASIEVNQVWNFANATSEKAARPFAGRGKWLSAFHLDKLTAGASACFEKIQSDTTQRVNAEFATRCKQYKKTRLRWRKSFGSNKALGWIPFKAVQLKPKGKSLRFSRKAIGVFEKERLEGVSWKCGCFSQDSVGDWFLCLPVALKLVQRRAAEDEVAIAMRNAATGFIERIEIVARGRAGTPTAIEDRLVAHTDDFRIPPSWRCALVREFHNRIASSGCLEPSRRVLFIRR